LWEDIETMDTEKKNPQFYTFLAVPHSNDKVFRIRIPYVFIRVASVLAVVSLLAVVFLTGGYLKALKNTNELEELRMTNSKLEEEVDNLNDRADSLRERMADLQEFEKNIRDMLDLGEDTGRAATVASHQVSRSFSRSRSNLSALPSGTDGNYMTNALGFSALDQSATRKESTDIREVKQLTTVLEAEMDCLNEIIGRLNTDVSEWKAYMNAKPSIWPVSGQVTSNFGYRKSPFGRNTVFHEGIDIAANYGVNVKATGEGVVERAGYYNGYGLCVIINHGYSLKTVYGHNSRVKVKVGDKVQKGQVIACVGSSGRSTGPHLHYEVRLNGNPVDPAKYMQ